MLNKEELEQQFGEIASFLEASDLGVVSSQCYELHEKERDEFSIDFVEWLAVNDYRFNKNGNNWMDERNRELSLWVLLDLYKSYKTPEKPHNSPKQPTT